MGSEGSDRFLLDQTRARLDMPATKEAVRLLSERWPRAAAKLVEDKANGPAVIQELRHQLPGLIEVKPEGGKVARAHAVSPMVEAGNVYLPHPMLVPWVEAFLEEMAAFPNGRHDDQVDAMTQALNRLRESGGIFHIPESQILIDPFEIPEEWPRAFGMAIQPGGVAGLWGACDPSGTIHLYAEHQASHAEPPENARAMKQCGEWIPGVLSTASVSGSQGARNGIAQIYREQGLTIHTVSASEQATGYQLWQMLATNKVKAFASLAGFLNAYRVGDQEAFLLQCCEALIAGREYMRTKPKPRTPVYITNPFGHNSWMAA